MAGPGGRESRLRCPGFEELRKNGLLPDAVQCLGGVAERRVDVWRARAPLKLVTVRMWHEVVAGGKGRQDSVGKELVHYVSTRGQLLKLAQLSLRVGAVARLGASLKRTEHLGGLPDDGFAAAEYVGDTLS